MKKINRSQSYKVHQEKDYALVSNTLNINKRISLIIKTRKANDTKRKNTLENGKN
jgi:hypothetical protein